MYKSIILVCVLCAVVIDAYPTWQFLPPKPGYVPVYIRPGDTPLEEINPELAEAFHVLPAGRSAGKELEASPDQPDLPEKPEELQGDQPQPETPEEHTKEAVEEPTSIDVRLFDKKVLEKKNKKATEITKPVESGERR